MAFDIYKRTESYSLVKMVNIKFQIKCFRPEKIDLRDLSGLTMI